MEEFAARAKALGFDKPGKYAAIERERRWLCVDVPVLPITETFRVSDLYVAESQLRLRAMHPLAGGPSIYKFAKKADLTPDRRVMTTIYLSEREHALLSVLPGWTLEKLRHRMDYQAVQLTVDVFEGALSGLVLAEVEFDTDKAMVAFETPPFAIREVTHDTRYSSGVLVRDGLPG